MQTWLILTFISGISSVIFNTFNRKTLKDGEDSTIYGWLFELIRLVIFFAILPWDYFLILTWKNVGVLSLLGLTELVGIYLYMKMHSYTELSISSILSRLRVIIVPIFAYIFLKEILTFTQYLGILLIFIGCMAITIKGKIHTSKGFTFILGFVLVNSISNVLMKASSAFASSSVVSIAFSLPSVILMPLIMKNSMIRMNISCKKIFKPTLVASIFNIVTMFTVISAYRLSTVSQVNSLFQGVTALSVIIGIIFLQEKGNILMKISGAILTTIGVALLQ